MMEQKLATVVFSLAEESSFRETAQFEKQPLQKVQGETWRVKARNLT